MKVSQLSFTNKGQSVPTLCPRTAWSFDDSSVGISCLPGTRTFCWPQISGLFYPHYMAACFLVNVYQPSTRLWPGLCHFPSALNHLQNQIIPIFRIFIFIRQKKNIKFSLNSWLPLSVLLVCLLRMLLSNSCWVLAGLAPAIILAVASCKNTCHKEIYNYIYKLHNNK